MLRKTLISCPGDRVRARRQKQETGRGGEERKLTPCTGREESEIESRETRRGLGEAGAGAE